MGVRDRGGGAIYFRGSGGKVILFHGAGLQVKTPRALGSR